MGSQLIEGPIQWTQDLNGSTSTTVYPSGATAGVAAPNVRRNAARVHLGTEITGTTVSTIVSLYGYTDAMSAGTGATWATSTWVFLGSLNGGASITPNTSTWSSAATRTVFAEVFSVSGANYSRYATRAVGTSGTNPLVSTYIGFVAD